LTFDEVMYAPCSIDGAARSMTDKLGPITGARLPGSYFAPNIPYLTILEQWHPSYFTAPQTLYTQDLDSPLSRPFRLIVHTPNMTDLVERKGVFSTQVDPVITGFDALCASLISDHKPFTFRDFGAILEVPHQNILCAFHRDINSNLQAGLNGMKVTGPPQARAEYQAYLEKLPRHQRAGMLKENVLKLASFLETPEVVLNNTHERHNEVIVVTRPGVNVHPGLPATARLKVTGYFMIDDDPSVDFVLHRSAAGQCRLTETEKDRLFREYIVPLAEHHGVPALRIAGAATRTFD